MIVAIQAVLIIALELGLQSWLWVAGVPLAFGMAAPVSSPGRPAAAPRPAARPGCWPACTFI